MLRFRPKLFKKMEYTFGENDDKVDEKEENEGNGAGNVGTPEDAFSQYL